MYYPDELDDYLDDLEKLGAAIDRELEDNAIEDAAAQDAEEMEFEDWQEHWVMVEGELVAR